MCLELLWLLLGFFHEVTDEPLCDMETLSDVLVQGEGLVGQPDDLVDLLGRQVFAVPPLVLLTESFVLSSPLLELDLLHALKILFSS